MILRVLVLFTGCKKDIKRRFSHPPILYHKMCFILADGFKSRWLESKHKSDYGQWKISAGKFYGDAELDKGEVLFSSIYIRSLLDSV